MAAVIPEAAEAVTEGTSAVRGASDARRAARPAPSRSQRFGQQARERGQRAARSAGRTAARARVPGNRQYQPAILAEFLVAILVTAVGPLAQGGDKTAQAKGGPSPYSADTLKQLVAIGAAYFLLAIASGSRKYGRTAAWFGGLILLAVGLNSFVTGGLVAIFGIFGPAPQVAPPDASGAELGNVPPGQQVTGGIGANIPGLGQGISQNINSGIPAAGQGIDTSVQNVTFSQPGVATTTESTPGVQVT